jgi:hypothetical protein
MKLYVFQVLSFHSGTGCHSNRRSQGIEPWGVCRDAGKSQPAHHWLRRHRATHIRVDRQLFPRRRKLHSELSNQRQWCFLQGNQWMARSGCCDVLGDHTTRVIGLM